MGHYGLGLEYQYPIKMLSNYPPSINISSIYVK